MGKTAVLYHASCADGFCAAYVTWQQLGDEAKYIPVQYEQPLPDLTGVSDVYILDFSYPRGVLLELAAREDIFKVVVLDHHKTAQEDLAGLGDSVPGLLITFDMERSGAMLAWDYWNTTPAPAIVRYAQDRDLWQHALPGTREVNEVLAVEPRTFQNWDHMCKKLEFDKGFTDVIGEGVVILRAKQAHVTNLTSKAIWVNIGDHSVPAVNTSLFQSEIGESLNHRFPDAAFAAIWFCPELDVEIWSLRSKNGFDVSAIARQYGGGGHAAAAGFRVQSGTIKAAEAT